MTALAFTTLPKPIVVLITISIVDGSDRIRIFNCNKVRNTVIICYNVFRSSIDPMHASMSEFRRCTLEASALIRPGLQQRSALASSSLLYSLMSIATGAPSSARSDGNKRACIMHRPTGSLSRSHSRLELGASRFGFRELRPTAILCLDST